MLIHALKFTFGAGESPFKDCEMKALLQVSLDKGQHFSRSCTMPATNPLLLFQLLSSGEKQMFLLNSKSPLWTLWCHIVKSRWGRIGAAMEFKWLVGLTEFPCLAVNIYVGIMRVPMPVGSRVH